MSSRTTFSACFPSWLIPVVLLVFFLYWPLSVGAFDVNVRVEGIDGDLKKNVEAYLQILQERDDPNLSPSRLKRLHKKAPDQIRESLHPFGYYQVQIEDKLTQTAAAEDAWEASYRVTPGQPVTVSAVRYELAGEATEDDDFPQEFGFKVGDPLDHTAYEAAKEALLFAAAEQGYLDAAFVSSRALVDPQANTAEVDIRFDSGAKHYFGEVRFEQDFLSPRYLRRFVELEKGEPYDQEAVLELQTSLLNTDHFKQVEMVPAIDEKDPETHVVPLDVHLTPNKRDKYRVGLGFSTDIGPKLTLEWRRRYLNRHGHRSKVEMILAARYRELSGEYWIPLEKPATENFIIRPEYHYLESASRTEEVMKVDVTHSVIRNDWRRNIGIEFRYEDYDISDDSADLNELVPFIEFWRTVSDNPLYTTKGHRLKFRLLGTTEFFGSSSHYLSATASGKYVHAFADDYRLITRADLGATWAAGILDVPGSRRFFAGGAQSIRGYDFEELGPRDPDTGDVLGGRFLAVGSLELERRIKGDWSGAVFYDFGNAFDPDLDNEFRHSVGIGARWRSPIGQIRLDFGVGIESDDTPYRLHLVIGPDL